MSTEKLRSALAQKNLDLCRARLGSTVHEGLDLSRTCEILAVVGLRVVDQNAIEAKPDMLHALATIASAALKDPETLHKIMWED